jgi:hypothetical protein
VQYGSVVTWGIPIDLHSEVVFNLVGNFLEDPNDFGTIQADSMLVQVLDGDVKPTIRNDTMHLHHELFGTPRGLHVLTVLSCQYYNLNHNIVMIMTKCVKGNDSSGSILSMPITKC